jgi:hypothetical protein
VRLSDRDRKLLWGRAANRCAYCHAELVVDATVEDRESIVGDEAHIVSESPVGPRGEEAERSDLDSYPNAILLCKVHHKMVDDQPKEYPSERLRRMKESHENWVRSTLSDAERATAEAVASEVAELHHAQEDEGSRLLSQFGPNVWCPQSNLNGPEVVLRCAAAFPAPVRLDATAYGIGHVTQLRGEAREDEIVRALNAAHLTAHVRALRERWSWAGDSGWSVLGGTGNPELTRLAFQVDWSEPRLRQPIGLTATVMTGRTNEASQRTGEHDGLVLAVDLSLNVLELDRERRPSQIAYRTTPAPAPAALDLAEVGDFIRALLTTPEIGLSLAPALLPSALNYGHVALWLLLNGVELERVVKLDSIDRLAGGLQVSRWQKHSPWPLPANSHSDGGARGLVAGFLGGLLEHADYRRFQTAVAEAVSEI